MVSRRGDVLRHRIPKTRKILCLSIDYDLWVAFISPMAREWPVSKFFEAKMREAIRARLPEMEMYACVCGARLPIKGWEALGHKCPECGKYKEYKRVV